jgi:hypothetical protein
MVGRMGGYRWKIGRILKCELTSDRQQGPECALMQLFMLQNIGLKRRTVVFGVLRPILNLRVELESLGNAFMVKAIELDVKLQNLAVGNYTAALLVRA